MSSLRAGVGLSAARSSGSRLAPEATTARRTAALLRALSRRHETPTMPTPCRRPSVAAASSSGTDDDGTQAEGFSPSNPQTTPEERRRSAGTGAVALPWYHLTPARTFLAASSLKLISFTMTTTFFSTALLPFGFWQSFLAAAGGVGLALLAKKLETEKFVERATGAQWAALVASAALAAVLFARLVPGRSNLSFSGALDDSPRSTRSTVSSSPSPSSRSPFSNPSSSSPPSSSLPPAPVRSAATSRSGGEPGAKR